MEYSEIFKNRNFSCVIEDSVNQSLTAHLIREDGQEDLIFALWIPSVGADRFTAIIKEIIVPKEGDRNVHGNASFNYQYFFRACSDALKKGYGVALLHSHPLATTGWQDMSDVDLDTEQRSSVNAFTITDLPFVGLTLGNDGFWSARVWFYDDKDNITFKWAKSVRTIGQHLNTYFNDYVIPPFKSGKQNIRTVNVWGEDSHKNITRLNIGIVGLGSVGSVVAEMLARMGISCFTLIDFDTVEEHNLDRLAGVYKTDIGKKKIDVIKRSIKNSSTSEKLEIIKSDKSIVEEKAYRLALDCDMIFCCVDRPWGRSVLNHIAYAHLIPVIDGGIAIEFNQDRSLDFADWTVHTISPGRPCMQCLEAFYPSDVDLEMKGQLENPSYIQGLPNNHHLKNRQNISPFTYNLASMEVMHFMVLATDLVDADFYCEQRFRFKHGHLSKNQSQCDPYCDYINNIGVGDSMLKVFNTSQ